MFTLSDREVKMNVEIRLNDLAGKDADEIAAFLRAKGIRGQRSSTQQCPVARYLNFDCRVGVSTICSGNHQALAPTPSNVKEFIMMFDNGAYEDLVA